ncbi:hypothetical protein LWI29_001696 [Acer saccharum]|uniref:non-specific serine/threonine protein kinase n=1 Tax=Acer saccharum TaxID=4024 RepID=A0AA39RQB1_ACESA|nr:hypothetical protein LWI29_001696 [Acer saccharum]
MYEGDGGAGNGAVKKYDSGTNWGFISAGDFMDDGSKNDNEYIVSADKQPALYSQARVSPLFLTYYGYCLENGNYTVNLHFAEIKFRDEEPYERVGRRIFDIYIQEKLELKDFNIKEQANGTGKAIIKTFNATVTENTLEIRLYWAGKGTTVIPIRGIYGPLISAISVCRGSEASTLRLDWATRQKICVGIARGLAFLHEESTIKIVHRDIKATNVLLDRQMNAKISDFGLAKLKEEDDTHISTRVAGTVGYMAPEYALWGHLTEKADVYSFGVVALEIASGRNNASHRAKNDRVCLLDLAFNLQQKGNLMEIVDPMLEDKFDKEEAEKMIRVALLCSNADPALRPTMSEVVRLAGRVEVSCSGSCGEAYGRPTSPSPPSDEAALNLLLMERGFISDESTKPPTLFQVERKSVRRRLMDPWRTVRRRRWIHNSPSIGVRWSHVEQVTIALMALYQNLSGDGLNSKDYYNSFHINCGGQDVTINHTVYEGDGVAGNRARLQHDRGTNWGFISAGDFMDDHNNNDNGYIVNADPDTQPKLYSEARASPLFLTYYGYCLENGNYTVNLHFVEILFRDEEPYRVGRRIFDIYIQGILKWKDFNIKEQANGTDKVIIKPFNATVTENTLEIRLYWAGKGTTCIPSRGICGPLISAISICQGKSCNSFSALLSNFAAKDADSDATTRFSMDTNAISARLKEEDDTHISTRVAGTVGYMAPEYALWGHLTEKADVYSFGVVALEIASGRNNASHRAKNDRVCLLDLAFNLQQKGNLMEIVDPMLEDKFDKEEAEKMIRVALLCSNADHALRPTMSEVVSMLESQTIVQEVASDPGIYGADLQIKQLKGFYQQMHDQSSSGSSAPNFSSERLRTSTTSAHDLYTVNSESIYSINKSAQDLYSVNSESIYSNLTSVHDIDSVDSESVHLNSSKTS